MSAIKVLFNMSEAINTRMICKMYILLYVYEDIESERGRVPHNIDEYEVSSNSCSL